MLRLAAVAVGVVLSTSPLYAQETQFTVTVSFANMHAAPSVESRIIREAPRGKSFEVTGERGKWVAIAWAAAPDGVAYVHSSWGTLSRSRAVDAPFAGLPPAVPVPYAAVADTTLTAPPPPVPSEKTSVPDEEMPAPSEDEETSAPAAETSVPVAENSVPAHEMSVPAEGTRVSAETTYVRDEVSRIAELAGRSTIPRSESAGVSGYSVQVAAVRDVAEARTLSDQLTKAGYAAYLTTATVHQVRFHRVRVGPFRTRQTARQVAQKLETQGYEAPWITK